MIFKYYNLTITDIEYYHRTRLNKNSIYLKS